jgi:hypothetical protein
MFYISVELFKLCVLASYHPLQDALIMFELLCYGIYIYMSKSTFLIKEIVQRKP